ncbi:hypothetical protein NA56DRAFT_484597 [Hyaloscypha hepaticicola]|uniref:Uncharacterized protein n=1 Tax=Hyaloscypha hepaticicola TaxID=2082293 RepID=A0A2J6PEJ4_9HELO|nr:hypothetical protein NA56DRAFT_484597 [Hyaloscypha hepaticicola]
MRLKAGSSSASFAACLILTKRESTIGLSISDLLDSSLSLIRSMPPRNSTRDILCAIFFARLNNAHSAKLLVVKSTSP